MDNLTDFGHRLCCCCLQEGCQKDIFSEYYCTGNREVYGEIIRETFCVEIASNTGKGSTYIQYICDDCITKLHSASIFKQMMIQNQDVYMKKLEQWIAEDQCEIKNELKLDDFAEENIHKNFNDSFDEDDQVLATLKPQCDNSNTDAMLDSDKKSDKRKHGRKIDKPERDLKKLIQHRGLGPILRENSLKLISNSSLSVFQWSKGRYRCYCCKEPYSDIDLLKKHTKTHTVEEIEKIIVAQQNRHVKVEISDLECRLCDKKVHGLSNLQEHLQSHGVHTKEHILVPFKIEEVLNCQYCFKSFTNFTLLNVHMNKYYQNYICDKCGLGFSNVSYLTQHRIRKHKPVKCKICNSTFNTAAEKTAHQIKNHNLKLKRKPRYPCQYCSERFYQENLKMAHLVEKHGVKKPEFICDFCPKNYITKSLLNAHVKMAHLKQKVHECSVCHKFFYTNWDLTRHKTTHSGKKNFSCVNCNNSFASNDSLRRHIRRNHSVH